MRQADHRIGGIVALVFLGLGDDQESWERIGRIANGEIIEDPTGELESTVKPSYDLRDEEKLEEVFNNHYINAIPTSGNSTES